MARTHMIVSDEAAREKLERLELEAAIREGAGILKDKGYPHWSDTDAVTQWVRASRRGELVAGDVPAR